MLGIFFIVIAIYFYISMFDNDSGLAGRLINKILFGMFGIGAYIFPVLLIILGVAAFYFKGNVKLNIKFYSFCLAFFTLLMLLFLINIDIFQESGLDYIETLFAAYELGSQNIGGGIIGTAVGFLMVSIFGISGTYVVIFGLFFISLIMFTGVTAANILNFLKSSILKLLTSINSKGKTVKMNSKKNERKEKIPYDLSDENDDDNKIGDNKIKIIDFTKKFDSSFKNKPKETTKERQNIISVEEKITSSNTKYYPHYTLPSTTLLFPPQDNKSGNMKKEIMSNVKILDETLKNFNVDATVSQVSVGPSITRYELQLSPGVKVSKIVNLADDISLSMAAQGIRIEAPIPGKAAVGIEIPNKEITTVYIREVLESDEFKNVKSDIAFALGKDVAGKNIIADIAKMPHLLIAGATGSGKSVCINSIIISILFKAKPNKVKMLMIDPKVVELSVYNGIPHLLVPVVTDPKKAAGALNWAVSEMTDRYKLFASKNVRDIKSYNALFSKDDDRLPQIVIIIDELSDLMMVAPNEVEDAICRLAQMARAAGIHLVVATQRPSVDVITGLIKQIFLQESPLQ